jgi:DNA repair exonuclease SbcCD ATPase subunit
MKNLFLKRLELRNFKGIKSFQIDFTSNETNILGKNTAGKTTIFDAYNWLLFGKDSLDRTDFPIKTFDKDNNFIPKLEHEVSAIIISDGKEIELRRVYTEKWTRKRANDIEELTGHETTFFINLVEKKKNEYESFIKELIDEQVSKLITNPLYFMEKMKWNDRREVLTVMAGEITNETILGAFEPSNELVELINNKKDLAEEKKVITQRVKILKDQLSEVETRIKEANYSDTEQIDFESIEKQIDQKKSEIAKLDASILDIQQANVVEQQKVISANNERFELIQKCNALEAELRAKNEATKNNILTKKMDIEREITHLKNTLENLNSQSNTISSNIGKLQAENDVIRAEFLELKAKQFELNPTDVCCPTCNREIDNSESKVNELKLTFNQKKHDQLQKLNHTGVSNKAKIDELTEKFKTLNFKETESKLESKQLELQSFDKDNSFSIQETTVEIEMLKQQIEKFVVPEIKQANFDELLQSKKEIEAVLEILRQQAYKKTEIQRRSQRILELSNEQKVVASQIAELQKTENQIDKFNETKMNIVEQRVNGLFKLVKWKMFNVQVNGGIDPACEAIVDGKPYSAMNKALQMNVGIDIVNALNLHYKILAPIFIDNRESITTLLPSNSQIINLIVDKECEILTIQNL